MTNNADKLIAYTVNEYKDEGNIKESWTRIGVAFPHKKSEGFTVQLDCHPVNGKIILRPPKAETQAA